MQDSETCMLTSHHNSSSLRAVRFESRAVFLCLQSVAGGRYDRRELENRKASVSVSSTRIIGFILSLMSNTSIRIK